MGSSKRVFLGFPEPVKDEMGNALGLIRTALVDVGLVERRLKIAQQDYEGRYGKAKR